MKSAQPTAIIVAIISSLTSACDSGNRQVEEERRLLNSIKPNVEVAFSDEGPVTIANKGSWRSYAVRVTNHFTQPIYFDALSDPRILPRDTADRNPLGYCYYIMKQTADGKWRDGDMGLFSTSRVRRALPPGKSIEFKAPVRIRELPMDDAVALRPKITIYCSADDRNGIRVDGASSIPIPPPAQSEGEREPKPN